MSRELELVLGDDNKLHLQKKKPTIILEFDTDEDLLNFLLDKLEFGVSDEEKNKIGMDIQNIRDEDEFLRKLNLKLDAMGIKKGK